MPAGDHDLEARRRAARAALRDGVEERHHVREYVSAVLGENADPDVYYAT